MIQSSKLDNRKLHYMPHLKTDILASPMRKTIVAKKDSTLPTLNEIHSKFKSNADYNLFTDPLLNSKQNLVMINRSSMKYPGSEILKSFNFALNPVNT